MTVLLILFLGIATLLWLSVFGYLLLLASIASRRRHGKRGEPTRPEIAVVIPTLNEEDLILPKLADLRRTDYPRDRMTIMVVDGGSIDRTTELVRQEISRGEPIQLIGMNGARGRTDQIIHALSLLTQDVVVVTDADSVLEPSCIRELVSVLERDPQTAMIGATVRPDSALLEERIHWQILNFIWWLEGEVLSSAGVSGVCYACRREVVLANIRDLPAEDIRLPFATSAGGYRTRICRTAHATEIRVPRSTKEFVRFRRRRGAAYVYELLRLPKNGHSPLSWRLARFMRLWHFLVAPKVGVGLVILAFVLLGTQYWPWPLLTFAAFAGSALAVLFASAGLAGDGHRWWRLIPVAIRWLGLTAASMLTLNSRPSVQGPVGGRS
ncbi:MAG: glycosyltransferase [bacterium]|nr:glycosyltransferase [bacterium]